MFWDLLESLVDGCEESVVMFSAIQSLNELRKLIDQLRKLRRVFALRDELIEGHVGLVVVGWVAWLSVTRGPMVRRAFFSCEEIEIIVGRL